MPKTTTWKNKSPIPDSNINNNVDNTDDLATFRDNQSPPSRDELTTHELARDFNYKDIPPLVEGMNNGIPDIQSPEKILENTAKNEIKTGKILNTVVDVLFNGDKNVIEPIQECIDTITEDCSWFIGIGNGFVEAGEKLAKGDGYQLGKLVMLMFMCVIYSIILLPSLIFFIIKIVSLGYILFLRKATNSKISNDDFKKAMYLHESYCLNYFSIFIGLFITLNWWYVIGYKTTYIDFAKWISSIPPLNFMFEHSFVSLHLFNYLTSARVNVGSPLLQGLGDFCWKHRPFMFFFLLSIITFVYANGGSQINSSFMGTAAQTGSVLQNNGPARTSSAYDGINLSLVFFSFLTIDLFNRDRLAFRMKTYSSVIIVAILLLVKLLFAIMSAGIGIQFALMLVVIYSFAGLVVSDFNMDIFKKINIIFIDLHNTVEETDSYWAYWPWSIYRFVCNNLISVYLLLFTVVVCLGNLISINANIRDTELNRGMFISTIVFSAFVWFYFGIWSFVEPLIDRIWSSTV